MAVVQQPQSGYLNSLLETLQQFDHPFVLIGFHAMCWQGTRTMPYNTFSLLVRNSQHDDIVLDLLLSGDWQLSTLDPQVAGCNVNEPSPGDTVLRSLRPDAEITYLRLYTEELYCLRVDEPLIRIPAVEARVSVLYEEEYHPDPVHFRYGPRTPSHPNTHPRGHTVKLPDPTSSLFVPTIQAHLNACLDQLRKYDDDTSKKELTGDASFNVQNWIRYLFLERPHQREKIMSEVYDRNKELMEDKLDCYKRKLCMGVDTKTMTMYKIRPWEAPVPEVVRDPVRRPEEGLRLRNCHG